MDPKISPDLTPDPTQDRAPPTQWRPMSGMAVFAFVFSLVGILVSAALWWIEIVPIALAVACLTMVSPEKRRGRALAVWAILIGLCVGSCMFVVHSGMRQFVVDVSGAVLSALASDATDAEKDDVLAGWMHPPALEDDTRARIRARFAAVTARLGTYEHPPEAGSFLGGMAPIVIPPQDAVEIRAEGEPDEALGQCFWARAVFRGDDGPTDVHVALELLGGTLSTKNLGGVDKDHEAGTPIPVVSDVRFFVSKGK